MSLVPAALLAFHPVDSADIGFQLATGDWIAAHHSVPRHDPFGTLPANEPWIAHDWLATLALSGLYRLGGAPALVLAAALLQIFALGLAFVVAARRGGPLVPFAVAALAATCIAYERFFVRPEAFTLALLALFAVLFARGAPRSFRMLAVLAGLQILWTNLHAAFVLGPAIAGLAAGCDLVRRRRSGLGATIPAPRLVAPFALAGACCITPYGIGILRAIAGAGRTLGAGELQRGIVEWQPTFSSPIASDFVLLVFVASLVAIAVTALACRRHLSFFETLLVVVFVALGASSRRHLVLYAVVAPAIAAGWASRALAAKPRGALEGAAACAVIVVTLLLAFDITRGAFARRFGPPRTLGWGWDAEALPLGAAEFVARHALPGPVFNNIAAGSALVWRLQGDPPPLVDGRLLDPVRFGAYRECLESTAAFDAWVRAHGTRLVVLGLQPNAPVQLFRHLEANPAWRLVAFDVAGAVFAVDSLAASRGLARVTLDRPLPATDAPAGRATRGWQECDPGPAGSRGTLLVRLGYPRAAVDDLSRALVACPRRMDVGVQLAIALVGDGRAPSARPLVEQALARDPADVEAWLAAGLVQRALGDPAGAREAWAHAGALAPEDPRPSRYLRALELVPPP